MAHPGSSSMIFAKTFSASSYSNEWSSAMPRLKSFFIFWEQDVSNSTVPNCLSGGPHKTTSPLLRSIAFIVSFAGVLFFSLHDRSINKNKLKTQAIFPVIFFSYCIGKTFSEALIKLLISQRLLQFTKVQIFLLILAESTTSHKDLIRSS